MLPSIDQILKFFRDLSGPIFSVVAVAIAQYLDYGSIEAIQFACYSAGVMVCAQVFRQLFAPFTPVKSPRRRSSSPAKPTKRRRRTTTKKDAK